jgi:hypothetical protein
MAEESSPIDKAIEGLANWGPLYWKPRITLKDLGYDNNLFHQDKDPVGSFIATLTPGIDLLLPMGRRNLLRLTEDLDLVYYEKDPPGFYMNTDGAILYDLYLNRIHLSLGDQFVSRYQRQNDEIDTRVRRNNNLIFGELLVDVSPRIQVGLTHDRDKIEYDPEWDQTQRRKAVASLLALKRKG